MTKRKLILFALFSLPVIIASAQQKKPVAAKSTPPAGRDSLQIPVSKADLGTFPYFKTLSNFYANDSSNVELNRAYFYDGKKYFIVDGHVSRQNLNIKDNNKKIASEFECIQQFDKVIDMLGGIKVYTGKFPEEALKSFAGQDIVELGSKGQVAPSAYYGVVEYVIKTADKEVWIQLQPYSLGSKFYTLLVVEKATPLITLNTNKDNRILEDLEKNRRSVVYLSFEPDKADLLSESKDEILSLAGVFQAHPDWKLKLESHSAPVGKADYTLSLTEGRASAVKKELMGLGVGGALLEAKGIGDQKPLVSNDTEQGRLTNTRFEITRQ